MPVDRISGVAWKTKEELQVARNAMKTCFSTSQTCTSLSRRNGFLFGKCKFRGKCVFQSTSAPKETLP